VVAPRGLGVNAKRAWAEAVAILGADDAKRYRTLLVRYVLTVDAAQTALARWDAAGRVTDTVFKNGAEGTHPLLQAWLAVERQATVFAAALGLTPASQSSVPVRRGRPVGAASAPDRRSAPQPPKLLRVAK
jgi:phage terminase small subunit